MSSAESSRVKYHSSPTSTSLDLHTVLLISPLTSPTGSKDLHQAQAATVQPSALCLRSSLDRPLYAHGLRCPPSLDHWYDCSESSHCGSRQGILQPMPEARGHGSRSIARCHAVHHFPGHEFRLDAALLPAQPADYRQHRSRCSDRRDGIFDLCLGPGG